MIAPYRIKFRNQTNIDFDLIVGAAFDSDSGNTNSFLNKESTSSNTYDGSKRNVHGYHYTDVMNVSFTFIKQDYTDMTDIERRKIYAWLTGNNKVEELIVYKDDSDVVSYRLLGNFTNVEHYKLANNRDVGVIVNFESIAPFAYSPVKSITKTITAPETFTLKCHTDVYEKPLYPKITVTIGDSIYLPVTEDPTVETYEMLSNTVYEYDNKYYIKISGQKHTLSVTPNKIENQTADASTVNTYCLSTFDKTVYLGIVADNQYGWQKIVTVGAGFEVKNTYYENGVDTTVKSTVTDCYEHEVITLDGDNRVIYSSYTPMRIIGESFNWDWIYFVPGENKITISGACDVTIEWVEPIKIGNI